MVKRPRFAPSWPFPLAKISGLLHYESAFVFRDFSAQVGSFQWAGIRSGCFVVPVQLPVLVWLARFTSLFSVWRAQGRLPGFSKPPSWVTLSCCHGKSGWMLPPPRGTGALRGGAVPPTAARKQGRGCYQEHAIAPTPKTQQGDSLVNPQPNLHTSSCWLASHTSPRVQRGIHFWRGPFPREAFTHLSSLRFGCSPLSPFGVALLPWQ